MRATSARRDRPQAAWLTTETDVVLGDGAQSKRVGRTAELLQRNGRWQVVLDGHALGELSDASYRRLKAARDAGFPVTCQVRILCQPERPLRVEADFPSD